VSALPPRQASKGSRAKSSRVRELEHGTRVLCLRRRGLWRGYAVKRRLERNSWQPIFTGKSIAPGDSATQLDREPTRGHRLAADDCGRFARHLLIAIALRLHWHSSVHIRHGRRHCHTTRVLARAVASPKAERQSTYAWQNRDRATESHEL